MVQSVELLLDDELDAVVRAQWRALADAGLPSQARHTGPTNRPHVTLAVSFRRWPEAVEAALRDAVGPLPLPVRLGGLVTFGQGGRYVLARLVVPSSGLLALHARIAAAVAADHPDPDPDPDPDHIDAPGHLAVGRWTPHVTLARRIDAALFPAALGALAAHGPLGAERNTERSAEVDGAGVTVRRWDGDAGHAWAISP